MSKVVVQNHFRVTELKFELATKRAIDRASRRGVAAVKNAPTRYRIRGILSKTTIVPARPIGSVMRGGFRNPDFRQLFFEYGTLKRRTKPLKRARVRKVRRGGIHPGYQMKRGREVARGSLAEMLRSELGKVR